VTATATPYWVFVALSGAAGTHLAARPRLPTRPATMLRLVRVAQVPQATALQAVGVDEWVWRRGRRFGTMVVNLVNHRVVDLLLECLAATLTAWLAQLWRGICALGYTHSTRIVCRFITQLRKKCF
jgi:hypothetical protein